MPRQLKPYKVDEFTHQKSGWRVDVMLDRQDKTFFAIVQGKRVGATDAAECTKLAKALCDELCVLDWRKYIIVDLTSKRLGYNGGADHRLDDDPVIGLEFEVVTLAPKPGKPGAWVRLDHTWRDGTECVRDHWGGNPGDKGETRVVIDHTPEAEAALESMQQAIVALKKKLSDFLQHKDLPARLASCAAQMLITDGKRGKA